MSLYTYEKGGVSNAPFSGPIGSIIAYAGTPGVFTQSSSTLSFAIYPGYHNNNLNYTNTTYNSPFSSTGSTGSVTSLSDLSVGTNAYILAAGTRGTTVITGYDKFTILWTGYFLSNYSGTWTFILNSDDVSYLWIGPMFNGSNYKTSNALITSNNNTITMTVDLVSGVYYPIRLLYGNSGGAGGINLSWLNNNLASTTNGTGFFYTGTISKTLLNNWLICDGTTYNITSYPLLANVISNAYGGDGTITFSVPNLQSHFISGCTGYGNSALNVVSGQEYFTLQETHLPSHSHSSTIAAQPDHTHSWVLRKKRTAGGGAGNQELGTDDTVNSGATKRDLPSSTGNGSHTHTVGNTNTLDNAGNSKPLRITPAHIALIYMIKYQ